MACDVRDPGVLIEIHNHPPGAWPRRRAASAKARSPGGRFGLRGHALRRGERVQDGAFEQLGVLGCAHDLASAAGGSAMPGDPPAGLRVDLQVYVAQPGPDGHGLRRVAGGDAVAVALERHQCVVGDDTLGTVLGGERQLRQGEQRLGGGELDRPCSCRADDGLTPRRTSGPDRPAPPPAWTPAPRATTTA